MGEFSPVHWLIVVGILVILFGSKRIPELMKGMGQGIHEFKKGIRGSIDDEDKK
jgi:sec-independent protein translocase protein TatA